MTHGYQGCSESCPNKKGLRKLFGAPFMGVWNLYLGEQSCWMAGELVCVCSGRRPDGMDGVMGMMVSGVEGISWLSCEEVSQTTIL
jgi:hypothetical protein